MLEANRLSDAEAELRKTMALAASVAGGHLMRNQAQAILAVVLVEQGRRGEARTLAADACRAKGPAAIRRLLEKAALCARSVPWLRQLTVCLGGRQLVGKPLIGAPAAEIIWAVAVVGLERLGRRRLVTAGNRVEELADQPERVHLVIVLARRERQKLRSQLGNP